MKKLLLIVLVLFSLSASALNSTHFTVQRISSPYFVVDGNSPATGPLTAYVGFKITNTSASTSYSNLKFTITSVTSNVSGQNYSLVSPASGITLVGSLAPGESKVCYFYVAYPANTTSQATFNYSLADATVGTKTGSFIVYNRSAISANAGGLATQSINNQDLIGGLVYDDVTYTLGNIRNGDESDFQISVSTQFDPTKLTLLKTQVISSTVPGVASGTNDLLYFTTTANQSSGTVTIRWTFRISSYNFTALILPYAGATSGASNYKYAISSDLGTGTSIVISSSANPLIISKTSDKITYGTSNTAIFTVTIQNPGAYPVSIDKITDEVPAGFIFQGLDAASQVTATNSTAKPAAGASGTITFEGGVVSGVNTSYTIPANGSFVLKYTATAPSSQASGLLTTVKGFIGVTQFGSALNIVNVSATLPVTIVSFAGVWSNSRIKLDWKTASENNSHHFEVERSAGNNEFKKIGTVIATGNSTIQISYAFTDSFPGIINNYRLKIVDDDGKFKYSSVISLRNTNTDNLSIQSIYPNPFSDAVQISLSIKKETQTVQLNFFDNLGHLVQRTGHVCYRGSNTILLNDAAKLPPGIYILQVILDKEILNEKLVKIN